MICFSFNPTTFEYIGLAEAYESPLEPGVFPLPAHATFVEPHTFDFATQVCKFNGATWDVSARPEPEPELPLVSP